MKSRGVPSLEPLHRLQTYVRGVDIAKKVFTGNASAVQFLASAPTIDSIPNFGGTPEHVSIILLKSAGRANVGKSSLINYICMRKGLAVTSRTPGRTQALNFFCARRVNGGGLASMLVDAPGYGARGRPEWGELFDHYIRNRRELRRVYILINSEHGVTADDKLMLQFLERESRLRTFTVQPVLTKLDKVPRPMLSKVVQAHQRAISEASSKCLPTIQSAVGRRQMGALELRHSILQACGWTPQLKPI
ncbi:P-loop containing nucleoside triphosphate hydrolase protein [Gautieria morchelliformis]|nr:P-loop containing nucleoside triphosphate hydrolase protein [Gautieria morchelliformis]